MPPAQPRDAQELFDEIVPQALAQNPERAREVDAVFLFKITGEGGGEWTVDLVSDPPVCQRGDSGKSQCAIEVEHDDFKDMLADPQVGMQLYFQGKLKVTGDPMLATKLQQFFSLTDSE